MQYCVRLSTINRPKTYTAQNHAQTSRKDTQTTGKDLGFGILVKNWIYCVLGLTTQHRHSACIQMLNIGGSTYIEVKETANNHTIWSLAVCPQL